jgi:hypothetical protein
MNNFVIEVLNVFEAALLSLSKAMAFFDLLIDVAETFAVMLISSIIIINQTTVLSVIHSFKSSGAAYTHKSPFSIPVLYLSNVFSSFYPRSIYWLNFK